MKKFIKDLCTFRGRLKISTFYKLQLYIFLMHFAVIVIVGLITGGGLDDRTLGILAITLITLSVIWFIPYAATLTRRLVDIGINPKLAIFIAILSRVLRYTPFVSIEFLILFFITLLPTNCLANAPVIGNKQVV